MALSMVSVGEIVTIYATDSRILIGEVVAFNSDGIEIKNKDGHFYYLYLEIEYIMPYS